MMMVMMRLLFYDSHYYDNMNHSLPLPLPLRNGQGLHLLHLLMCRRPRL